MKAGKSQFHFQKFSVEQGGSAMKIGTDAVLLGAWTEVEQACRILDVGTGCGIIALMMAQRNTHAKIHAIEPEERAWRDAYFNFKHSPWSERLSCSMETLQEHQGQYDLIITNPPFFLSGNTAKTAARRTARHALRLTQEELLNHSAKLLSPEGKLSLVLPVNEGHNFIDHSGSFGLFLERHCLVYSTENEVRRRMMTFSKHPASVRQEQLTIRIGGKFTPEYKSLTRYFYLRFSD